MIALIHANSNERHACFNTLTSMGHSVAVYHSPETFVNSGALDKTDFLILGRLRICPAQSEALLWASSIRPHLRTLVPGLGQIELKDLCETFDVYVDTISQTNVQAYLPGIEALSTWKSGEQENDANNVERQQGGSNVVSIAFQDPLPADFTDVVVGTKPSTEAAMANPRNSPGRDSGRCQRPAKTLPMQWRDKIGPGRIAEVPRSLTGLFLISSRSLHRKTEQSNVWAWPLH